MRNGNDDFDKDELFSLSLLGIFIILRRFWRIGNFDLSRNMTLDLLFAQFTMYSERNEKSKLVSDYFRYDV